MQKQNSASFQLLTKPSLLEHAFWLPQSVTEVQEVSSSSVHDMLAHGFSQVSLFFFPKHMRALFVLEEIGVFAVQVKHII